MKKNIKIIGVPLYHGGPVEGTDLGCAALRYAGIKDALSKKGHNVEDLGDIFVNNFDEKITSKNMKSLEIVRNACIRLREKVASCLENTNNEVNHPFPLILGGDHSLALGSIQGVLTKYSRLGVIWVDAHTDINTNETSPSGNIHGMPLSALLGLGASDLVSVGDGRLNPKNIVFIGARDIDSGERDIIEKFGITVFGMDDFRRLGVDEIVERATSLVHYNTDAVHISFDVDVMDPDIAVGTGTKVSGGMTKQETSELLTKLIRAVRPVSMDTVEVNPILDCKNETAKMVVDILSCCL